jgi:hypothetical protein
MHPLVGLLVAR